MDQGADSAQELVLGDIQAGSSQTRHAENST